MVPPQPAAEERLGKPAPLDGVLAGRRAMSPANREVDPGRAWPVFQALLQPTTSSRRPLLAAAISLGITEGALAELLADQFAKAVQTTVPVPAASPDAVPAAPHDRRVVFLCSTASTLCELQAALNRCPKPRSAPGIDGVTYQML